MLMISHGEVNAKALRSIECAVVKRRVIISARVCFIINGVSYKNRNMIDINMIDENLSCSKVKMIEYIHSIFSFNYFDGLLLRFASK